MEGYVIIRIPNSLLINLNLIKLIIYIIKQLVIEYNIKVKQKELANLLNISDSYASKLFKEAGHTLNNFKQCFKQNFNNVKQKTESIINNIKKNLKKDKNEYLHKIIRLNANYYFVTQTTNKYLYCIDQNLTKTKIPIGNYIAYDVGETYHYCQSLYDYALNYLNNN